MRLFIILLLKFSPPAAAEAAKYRLIILSCHFLGKCRLFVIVYIFVKLYLYIKPVGHKRAEPGIYMDYVSLGSGACVHEY